MNNQNMADNGRERAMELALQIHEHMSFDEVSKIVPLTKANKLAVREHGGAWFRVSVGKNYCIQLRFECSPEGYVSSSNLLNLPPVVKPIY